MYTHFTKWQYTLSEGTIEGHLGGSFWNVMLICDNVGSHCQHLLSANYLGRGQKAAQRHQKMASLGPGNVGELWLTKAATNKDCEWVLAIANFWN